MAGTFPNGVAADSGESIGWDDAVFSSSGDLQFQVSVVACMSTRAVAPRQTRIGCRACVARGKPREGGEGRDVNSIGHMLDGLQASPRRIGAGSSPLPSCLMLHVACCMLAL